MWPLLHKEGLNMRENCASLPIRQTIFALRGGAGGALLLRLQFSLLNVVEDVVQERGCRSRCQVILETLIVQCE